MTDLPLNFVAFSRLRAFAKLANPRFSDEPKHIKLIADALEKVEKGEIKRLIITVPPRHGKSMLSSELFPAWFIGRNPTKSIIFATYNQDFARDFGRKVRNHMASDAFRDVFPSAILSDDSAASDKFHTTKGGVYYAVGMGSSITGRGAHILLIDDPLKNKEEADSSLIRHKHKEWFSSTAYTRLEPDGACIIIMTRWHNDDLAGWLLAEKKEHWTQINLPAVSTVDGAETALWHERYSMDDLNRIRNTVSSRDWAALYMQTPVQEGGRVFKTEWLQYYDDCQHRTMNNYMFIDPANSKDKDSDNTSIMVIGANKDRNYYLVDAWIDKLNLKEREDIIFGAVEKYQVKQVHYEKYGMQLDIEYMRRAMEYRNFRFSINEVGGSMAKVDRITRLQPLFEDRRIVLPRALRKLNYLKSEVDLIDHFVNEEYTPFPHGRRDDALDCMSRMCDVQMLMPSNQTLNYHELYRNAR